MPLKDRTARKAYMDAFNAARREERKLYQQQYYIAHRAERIAAQHAYHAANRERINAEMRQKRAAEPERFREKSARWKRDNPKRVMLNSARKNAKRLRVAFALTPNDFDIPNRCPVFGWEFKSGDKWGNPQSATLDRVDCTKGYVPGNIRVISWRANRLKSDGTVQEFEQIIRYIREHS